jgi:co-chaperonin GroES (HSP10)
MPPEQLPFEPTLDRVLVRRIAEPRKDGLVLIRENPDCVDVVSNQTDGAHGDYRRVPVLGVVVAVGPGRFDKKFKFHPTTVKPGEVVIFTEWNDWAEAPEDLYLIREADIWGRYEA